MLLNQTFKIVYVQCKNNSEIPILLKTKQKKMCILRCIVLDGMRNPDKKDVLFYYKRQ